MADTTNPYVSINNPYGITDAQWGVRIPDSEGRMVDMVTRTPVGSLGSFAMPPRTSAWTGTWQPPAALQSQLTAAKQTPTYDQEFSRWNFTAPVNPSNVRGRYPLTSGSVDNTGLLSGGTSPTLGHPSFTGLLSQSATPAAATPQAPAPQGAQMSNATMPTGAMNALAKFSSPSSAWQQNYNDLYAVDPRLAMNYAAKANTGNEFRRALDSQYGDGGAQAFNYWYSPNSAMGGGGAYSRAALNGNKFTYIDSSGKPQTVTLKY